MGKLSTFSWYLMRPRFYPQLVHVVAERLFQGAARRRRSRSEMSDWCNARGVDTSTALEMLGVPGSVASVRDICREQFEEADRRANECPVKMGGAGNLDLIYWLAEHNRVCRVIETGVAYGWSSLAILLSLRKRDEAQLVSTDMPYPRRDSEAYVGCVVPDEFRAQWLLVRHADRRAIPKAVGLLGEIDMCHYDSDKTYGGRMWAYRRLWNALRAGGVFISDDIGDNTAFRDFALQLRVNPIVIRFNDKYMGVIVKPCQP